MKLVRVVLGVALIGMLGACGAGKYGAAGAPGADGTSCTVAKEGTVTTITCGETVVTVTDGAKGADGANGANGVDGANGANGADGQDGVGCTAEKAEGVTTVTCGDQVVTVVDGVNGTDGTNGDDGQDGTSCTVAKADGVTTITCGDQIVTVADGTNGVDGQDGTSCTVAKVGTETTITCGDQVVTVVDGANGTDGTSCGVVDNGDGTKTIACTDGTQATVADGTDGINGIDGADGTSCTVVDNLDGTKTITCGEAFVTVTDGAKGDKGDKGDQGDQGDKGFSCTVTDNGGGVKTISCEDGTSATVNDGATGAAGADGADGADGAPGLDGVGCTVVDNGDGTKTITCANGSVTVSDGATGPSAAYVVNVNAEVPAQLLVTVTNVTFGAQAVIKFTVKDNIGRGVVGLKATTSGGNLRFALAKLVPANLTTGEPSDWLAYVRSTSGGPSSDRGGALLDNGDGTYQYTTAYNKFLSQAAPYDYDANATTRLAIQLSGSSVAGALPYMNAIYDFVPATNAAPAAADNRIVATTAACNECHGQLTLHGSRTEVGYCNQCHVEGLAADGIGDLAYMTHAIHGGSVRGAAHPYVFAGNDYSEVTYPQNIALCKKCHDGATSAQGDNWKNYPTKGACGSCHAETDFNAHPSFDPQIRANDSCKGCHSANGISKAHQAENASTHATQVPVGAYNFTYEIKEATVDGTNHPIITFKIGCTKVAADGTSAVCNTAALPIDLKTSPADLVFGPSFLLAHKSAPADPTVKSGDFDNIGYTLSATANTNSQPLSVSLANLKDGTKGTLSDPDANGYYTATLTGTNAFPAGAVMRTIALQGYFSQSGVTGFTGNLGRHTVAAVKTVTGDVPRRQIVDSAKCGNCHEWFEGHGGNRVYNIDVCTTCHVPTLTSSGRIVDPAVAVARLQATGTYDALVADGYDATDPLTWPEQSQNLKDLIHGIHQAEARGEEVPFNFVRDRGTSGVYYYNFAEVTYPQREQSNCLACHKAGTYDAELPTSVTISNVTTGVEVSDSIQVVPGADRAAILANRRATPTATDLVSTPITATCSGCHTSELAYVHFEQNGGALWQQRDTITEVETCTLCHGVGSIADTTVIHPAFQ